MKSCTPARFRRIITPSGNTSAVSPCRKAGPSCYLRLNGADSAAAVWCNGVYIGYTEDTFTPG